MTGQPQDRDERTGAELLRDAARLMRERANGATPGRWQALMDGYGDTSRGRAEDDRRDLMWVRSGYTNHGDIVTTYGCPDSTLIHDNVSHIASWHPAVALAVADWLDSEAHVIEVNGLTATADIAVTCGHALAVARAYLSAGLLSWEETK